MFGGLISCTGNVTLVGDTLLLTVSDAEYLKDVCVGQSVAVDGVCLTLTSRKADCLTFHISPETMGKTTLKSMASDTRVNVERPLRHGDYLGGHYVQGHVQQVGTLSATQTVDGGFELCVRPTVWDASLIIHKNSVAINGVSLTIASVDDLRQTFTVAMVPHTVENTAFAALVNGRQHQVNLEFATTYKTPNYMQLALECGEQGRETAPPNPWVGCILVAKDGRIIGKGYHARAGEPHAEIMAFRNADENGNVVEGCTLYVTLEPCHHHGRTPPCDLEIVRRRVASVVVGTLDPDARVAGQGVALLREHGTQVTVCEGEMAEKVQESLRPYLYHRRTAMPYVTLKIALSLDGAVQDAHGQSRWISGPESRQHAHGLRAQSQAIVVGSQTAINDQPTLNVRLPDYKGKQPLRVVVDGKSRVKRSGPLFDQGQGGDTLVYNRQAGEDHVNLRTMLHDLGSEHGVLQCLVEGGPGLHGALLSQGLINEVYVYTSSKLLGAGSKKWSEGLPPLSVSDESRLTLHGTQVTADGDVIQHYRVQVNEKVHVALDRFRRGDFVLVMDDETRENEGDLICWAPAMTHDRMVFLVRHTTGLTCVSMTADHAAKLALPPMCVANQDNHQTAFTVTCDAVDTGTGVSAADRLLTVHALTRDDPVALCRPGHVFPLVARDGLLQVRRGHTEASLALCAMAGLSKVAVLSELQNDDGTMMNRAQCLLFSRTHNIPIVSVADLERATTAATTANVVEQLAECEIHLKDTGQWTLACFDSGDARSPHRALIKKCTSASTVPLVRVHSDCFTGDVLRSLHCDCGEQLAQSLSAISRHGHGALIMVAHQEGRGIGLTEKVKAYKMQQSRGCNTFEANRRLGHPDDTRDYAIVAPMLKHYGFHTVTLMTENPAKVAALVEGGIQVQCVQPVAVVGGVHCEKYLKDKRAFFKMDQHFHKTILECPPDLPAASQVGSSGVTVHIVAPWWHDELVSNIVSLTVAELGALGVAQECCTVTRVPGCWEVPFEVARVLKHSAVTERKVFICFGVLIKGDTGHFDQVANPVSHQMMTLQVSSGVPIVNAILTCHDESQAVRRTQGDMCASLAKSYASTAVQMALK